MPPQTDHRRKIALKIVLFIGAFMILVGIGRLRAVVLMKDVRMEGTFTIEGRVILERENPELLKKNPLFLKPTRFDTQDLDGSVHAQIGQEVRCQAEFAPTSRDQLDGSTLKLSKCTKID